MQEKDGPLPLLKPVPLAAKPSRPEKGLTQGHSASRRLGVPNARTRSGGVEAPGDCSLGRGVGEGGERAGPGNPAAARTRRVGLPFAERPAGIRSPPARPPRGAAAAQPEVISAGRLRTPEGGGLGQLRGRGGEEPAGPGLRPEARECARGPPCRVGPPGPATRAAAPG